MPVQKIKSGRIITVQAETYVGDKGIIFYDENTPELRLSDGVTPGGIPFTSGSSGYVLVTATNTRLGGVKIGANINIEPDGTISIAPVPTNISDLNNDVGFLTTGSDLNSFSDVDIVNIQNGQTLIYNSSTSKFENTSINLTGGSANQILVKQSGSDYDYQWENLNITLPTQVYTKLIDDVSTVSTLYLGEAVPESVESDPVWRIQKIVFDANGNVDSVRFAGTGTFTQVWNDRVSLTYL
jgi:hypothetical protein